MAMTMADGSAVASIERLKQVARQYHGVHFSFYLDRYFGRQTLYFSNFGRRGMSASTPPGESKKGAGKRILQRLVRLADQYGLPIELWTNVAKLRALYESLGFIATKTRPGTGIYATTWIMRREPQEPTHVRQTQPLRRAPLSVRRAAARPEGHGEAHHA